MAQLLGQVNPGTIVKLNENGQPVEFYVAAQDYESGLNGQGRVLIVRKDGYTKYQWSSGNRNTYDGSTIDTWFNSSYLQYLDSDIQNFIGTTKIYATSPYNSGVIQLEKSIFALSCQELGGGVAYASTEGTTLPTANLLKIAYSNGSPVSQWTRSPITENSNWAVAFSDQGDGFGNNSNNSFYARPAFTLPATMTIDSNSNVNAPANLSIYTPSLAMQGQSLPIQWSPISNATSYQLQRNTGSTWETIYTGTDTSYTDTVGSWTTVQYQVAVDIGGGYGAYSQSASIPVIEASTLAISGQDGSLGTITADIPYTVTSDTDNPISIVRTVNGVRYASATVESGFAYNIPVMELPTGDGTIVITASVQSSSGLVTVTRTWTYTKTPINFSNSGSVASLSVNGQNILPTTLAEAVRTNPVWGGSLDLALQKLSSAAFYETITPTAELGSLAEGSIIYLNENGSPVEFYVAKQNYEPSYNADRVLVVRKDTVQQGAWNSTNVNTYDGSTIDMWFNQTYLQTLDSNVQSAIGTTNIPATSPYNSGVIRLNKSVFALSTTEFGAQGTNANVEGSTLPITSELLLNTTSSNAQLTRSPVNAGTTEQIYAIRNTDGKSTSVFCNVTAYSYKPAFTLPSDFNAPVSTVPTTGLYDIQNNLLLSLPGVNIETGSYTGTGTYGSSNPNSLTFGFVPKFVVISGLWSNPYYSTYTYYLDAIMYPSTGKYQVSMNNNTNQGTIELNGTTMKWWETSGIGNNLAAQQGNAQSSIYNYIAIG